MKLGDPEFIWCCTWFVILAIAALCLLRVKLTRGLWKVPAWLAGFLALAIAVSLVRAGWAWVSNSHPSDQAVLTFVAICGAWALLQSVIEATSNLGKISGQLEDIGERLQTLEDERERESGRQREEQARRDASVNHLLVQLREELIVMRVIAESTAAADGVILPRRPEVAPKLGDEGYGWNSFEKEAR